MPRIYLLKVYLFLMSRQTPYKAYGRDNLAAPVRQGSGCSARIVLLARGVGISR